MLRNQKFKPIQGLTGKLPLPLLQLNCPGLIQLVSRNKGGKPINTPAVDCTVTKFHVPFCLQRAPFSGQADIRVQFACDRKPSRKSGRVHSSSLQLDLQLWILHWLQHFASHSNLLTVDFTCNVIKLDLLVGKSDQANNVAPLDPGKFSCNATWTNFAGKNQPFAIFLQRYIKAGDPSFQIRQWPIGRK